MTDLRPDEVEVLEEGQPKAILSFRFVDRTPAPAQRSGGPRRAPERSPARGDPQPDARHPAVRRARRRGAPVRPPGRARAARGREPAGPRVLGVRDRQPASAAPAVHDGPRRGGRRRRARLQRARPAGPRAGSGRHGAGGRHREPGQRQGAGGRGRRDRGRRRRGRRRLRAGGGRRRLRQRRAAGRRHGRERRAQPARQQLAVRPVRAGAAGAAARRAQGDRLLLRGPAGPQPAAAALPLGGQRGQPREPQHLRRRRAGAAHQLRLRPREDRPHEVARERAPAGPVARRPRRHPRGRARGRGGRGRDHDERPGHARRALGEHGRPADRQQQRRARRTRPRRGRHLAATTRSPTTRSSPRSTARSGASG